MSEKKFVVKHHLDQLSPEELAQYLRDVSTFIGLDPDLGGLDTIWLDNETGVGRTLVVYAKRGTAEILRNIYGVDVDELSHSMVKGSIVFVAAGKNSKKRVERAIGSKYIEGLTGRVLDSAIMTASTRALRRLTMQFTTLGILDESEVVDIVGQPVNPAGTAQLAGSPIVIPPQPSVPVNNTPGKPVEPIIDKTLVEIAKAQFPNTVAQPDISPDIPVSTNVEKGQNTETSATPEADKKADKKPRKKKNTVSLEVEPEVVTKSANGDIPQSQPSATQPLLCLDCKKLLNEHPLINSVRVCPDTIRKNKEQLSSTDVLAVMPLSVAMTYQPQPSPTSSLQSAPAAAAPVVPQAPIQDLPVASAVAGLPSQEQMGEYRKKISVFTQQLPATPGLGSVQRMRAFITRMSDGVAPQNMTVVQWEKLIAWFDQFVATNGVKGLLKYIGDTLGDVKG